MKIATMATGGIGGFLASRLTQGGYSVAAIARGAHLAAIQKNGLTLVSSNSRTTVHPWIATDDTVKVGEVDAVILAVKGDDLSIAAEACRPMLGPTTVIVPFLNGVEAAERLAVILPPKNVADGVAYISTSVAGPGIIQQTGEFNRFVFAERDNRSSSRIEALRAAIKEAGSSAPPTDNIEAEVWRKFVLFAAVSGVTAAARCTMSEIMNNEPLAELFRCVISETAALARRRGVVLPDTIENDTWSLAMNLPPTMRASTAIDLENGRPLEIDWISGAVARLSNEANLPAPVNRALYALLSPYRNGEPRA